MTGGYYSPRHGYSQRVK